MKKIKRILITALSVLMLFSVSMAVACAGGDDLTIKLTEPIVPYYIGDNVDMFDFIEEEDGVVYSFTVTDEDGKETALAQRTFYAAKSGEFSVAAKASVGKKTGKADFKFTVTAEPPVVSRRDATLTHYWKKTYDLYYVIAGAEVSAVGGIENLDLYLSFVEVIPSDGSESFKVDLWTSADDSGESDEGGFYDGYDRFTYQVEGTYKFNLVIENAGGRKDLTVVVNCIEDLSKVAELSEKVTFDDDTKIASWEKVDAAKGYKVKGGGRNYFVGAEVLTYDFSDAIKNYDDYTINVIALNEDGSYIGKMTCVAKTFSNAITENADGSVTLKGVYPGSNAISSLHGVENNYLAFRGEYGVGTYAQFIFKGNNMPSVLLFADDVNRGMTYESGDGVLVLAGCQTEDKPSANSTVDSEVERLCVYGPNRINQHYTWGAPLARIDYSATSPNKIFTQKGLTEAGNDVEYRYVVGTKLNDSGEIVLVLALFDNSTGSLLAYNEATLKYGWDFEISNKSAQPGKTLTEADVTAGSIVAYASLNGEGNTTTFKYIEPTTEDVIGDIIMNGEKASDGTVTLKAPSVPTGTTYGAVGSNNSYIAIQGNYGVGTYTEFTFKGNNMPSVLFFADNINGNITYGGGNGIFVLNGLKTTDASYLSGSQVVSVFGPNRINTHPSLGGNYKLGVLASDGGMLTQKWFEERDANAEYSYILGTSVDGDGYLNLEVFLGDKDKTTLMYYNKIKLYYCADVANPDQLSKEEDPAKIGGGILPESMWRYLTADDVQAGNIIAYASFKGANNDTTFKCEVLDGAPTEYTFDITYDWGLGADAVAAMTGNTNKTSYSITDTADSGITLVAPTLQNATFVEFTIDGKPVTEIPKGTIGNVTVHAKWKVKLNSSNVTYLMANTDSEFELTEDIDMSSIKWTEGQSSAQGAAAPNTTFSGILDGKGYTMSGMQGWTKTAKTSLFYRLHNATIKNLSFTNVYASEGVFSARQSGTVTLENVVVRVTEGKPSERTSLIGRQDVKDATVKATNVVIQMPSTGDYTRWGYISCHQAQKQILSNVFCFGPTDMDVFSAAGNAGGMWALDLTGTKGTDYFVYANEKALFDAMQAGTVTLNSAATKFLTDYNVIIALDQTNIASLQTATSGLYYLTKDIDMSTIDFNGSETGNGNYIHTGTFTGIFDGAGYKLYNFNNSYGSALFNAVENATVRNLAIDGDFTCAVIASASKGGVTVENVVVNVKSIAKGTQGVTYLTTGRFAVMGYCTGTNTFTDIVFVLPANNSSTTGVISAYQAGTQILTNVLAVSTATLHTSGSNQNTTAGSGAPLYKDASGNEITDTSKFIYSDLNALVSAITNKTVTVNSTVNALMVKLGMLTAQA